jgi:AcrR family transcriptional regulator
MVRIQHTGENRDKLEFLIRIAQDLFGLYGLEKTTMRDIAEEAGMSKASLYYYFPDKNSLFHAVIEKELEEFFHYLYEKEYDPDQPGEMLRAYISLRNQYFRKFYNLSKLRLSAMREFKPIIHDLTAELRRRETEYIRGIIVQGREKGYYRDVDVNVVAELFLDGLQAIRRSYLGRSEMTRIESADLEIMEKKMMVLLDIFINGIAGNPAR